MLLHGRWDEIDFVNKEWRIAKDRMKGGKREHIVPLSQQAIEILQWLKPLTGDRELLFPAIGAELRPISENSLNAALRRMGFAGDVMVSHGFRSLASSTLNELNVNADLIELQLAHVAGDVRSVYNRSLRLDERRLMMQRWSDHLDRLAAGGEVIALPSKRRCRA